jgi:non-canonical purine NTP pyrophosphatase (RdgB/HAM1 family)
MQTKLLYVTGNGVKFHQADLVCQQAGIQLEQRKLDVTEIQAEDGETIARDKAAKAFALLQQPVVISDDTTSIPGLKGFPGPYMKYVNDWFTPEDWLRLTIDLDDRRIILRQVVVYQDEDGQEVFSVEIPGVLLKEIRGTSPYPHTSITSYDSGRHSNAEMYERGESASAHLPNVWHEFADWYSKRTAA